MMSTIILRYIWDVELENNETNNKKQKKWVRVRVNTSNKSIW